MRKDYHTHPQILQKPEMFDRFVRVALENGIEELCITDHMPLLGDDAADRIYHGKVAEYCRRVRQLQKAYSGVISIKCGIEIDYHPTTLEEVDAVLKDGEFDFILGSSHLHAMSKIHIFREAKTHNGYAKAMFENTLAAAQSGLFHAISHIDMYRWIFTNPEDRFPLEPDGFSESLHAERICQILDTIKANNMRLEINPHLALGKKNPEYMYPSVAIVQMALDRGVRFSFGSDAHIPEDIGGMLPYLREHPVYAQALATWEGDSL